MNFYIQIYFDFLILTNLFLHVYDAYKLYMNISAYI